MLELLVAFSAGLLSFLSPCVLPLIPGYISYISGQTLSKIVKDTIAEGQNTLLFAIYNSSNQRSYLTVKLN